MSVALIIVISVIGVWAEKSNGSFKDMLHGYLTGQLSSALGTYQVEALRREFKSFTDQIEKLVKSIKEKTEIEKSVKGIKDKTELYAQKIRGKINLLNIS